jgi:hypothetical protein
VSLQSKKQDMKTTVKLRVKKLADGNGGYYLDWFQNGKRHYEYLKLYTVLSDRPTKDEREANRESLKLAQQIRNQREKQLIAKPQGITPTHKRKQFVLAYLEANSSTKGGELMTEHFHKFLGGRDFQNSKSDKRPLARFFRLPYRKLERQHRQQLFFKNPYHYKAGNRRKDCSRRLVA